ncbi:MAG: streptogrisin, partial [Solirubrobacterales bacterium]|nr:streptogrisin [Solirubrobacterales bacterium]
MGLFSGRTALGRFFGLVTVLAVAAIAAPLASADIHPFEVNEYRKDFDVPVAQAEEALETQEAGTEADIVGALADRLGSSYAGVWFDNQTGEFVIPIAAGSGRDVARSELTKADLQGDFRIAAVRSSWAELEVAQRRLDTALSTLVDGGLVQTSLDPRTNSVVIAEAEGIDSTAKADLLQQATAQEVKVEIRGRGLDRFQMTPAACSDLSIASCDAPMRGGVPIQENGPGPEEGITGASCTAGFKALGVGNGNRYVITAGHCAKEPDRQYMAAFDSLGHEHYLGYTEQAYWGNGHDVAKINATGVAYWDIPSWPNWVVEWSRNAGGFPLDPAHKITSEASSFLGQYVCHSGATTGTSCGYVRALNVPVSYEPSPLQEPGRTITVNHMTEAYGVCIEGGDSGGPVFAGNTALGITSFKDAELPECNNVDVYSEITEDTSLLGVKIGPFATTTDTAVAGVINGQPGSVTVNGHVYSNAPVNNAHVYLNF